MPALQEDLRHLHLDTDRVAAYCQLLLELLADHAQPALLEHLLGRLRQVHVGGAVEDGALRDVHLNGEVFGIRAELLGELEVSSLEVERAPPSEVLLIAGVVLQSPGLGLVLLLLGLLLGLGLCCLD